MFRFAVCGSGYIGAEFARLIRERDDCEVSLVYSPGESAERLGVELGVPFTRRFEDLLSAHSCDVVLVTSPSDRHKEQVIRCAEAGKHVFCEKPFALSLRDAEEMVEACRAAGVVLMVGHVMHFYPIFGRLKREVDEGRFGVVVNAHVERTGWEERQESVSWKKMKERSGGHLFHHIHELDLIQWFLGRPDRVYAVGGVLGHRGDGFGNEDDVTLVTLSYEDRCLVSMEYGSGFRIGNHLLRLNGDKGGVEVDFKRARVRRVNERVETQEDLFEDASAQRSLLGLFEEQDGGIAYGSPTKRPPFYLGAALAKELDCFVRALNGFVDPFYSDLFDGSSAKNSVEIAELATESARIRREVLFQSNVKPPTGAPE